MLFDEVLQLFLEIEKEMRIFFNIFFPLWTLEVFAYADDVLKEFFSEFFGHLFHQPRRDKIDLCIDVHPNINQTHIFFYWSVSDYEIFVIELDVVRVHCDWKLQYFLKTRLVVNWSGKKEDFFRWMVKSTVTDSLEERLSSGEQREMVLSVTNSAVSGNLFFLSRNF